MELSWIMSDNTQSWKNVWLTYTGQAWWIRLSDCPDNTKLPWLDCPLLDYPGNTGCLD